MEKVTENHIPPFSMGERLKECRNFRGLSQEQLAEAVERLPDNRGKTRSAKQISYLENGTRALSLEYAELCAQALNVRVEYLLLKDDYRTEGERITKSIATQRGKFDLIVELLRLHGYHVEDVTETMPAQPDIDGRKYQPATVSLTSPRGSKRFFEYSEFSKLVSQIDDSIEMQCAFQFRKLLDGASNVYVWEV